VGDLFLDDTDYKGLIFWYKDVLEVDRQLKANTKQK
jgi:hypothetical protein